MRVRHGDVALVTGAGSGIGWACVLEMARKGCSVVAGDVDEEAAVLCAEHAAELGVRAVGVRCDVTSDAAMVRLFETALSEFGRIDIAVLNAGVGYYGLVEETSAEALGALFEVNVVGVQRGLVHVVPLMRSQRRGTVVITGSVNGLIAWPYHGAYAATKFALTGLARTLRMELAGSGVHCLLALPANVQTDFYRSATTVSGYEPAPIGRGVSAEQVTRVIVRGIERDAGEVFAAPGLVAMGARAGGLLPGLARKAGQRWQASSVKRTR